MAGIKFSKYHWNRLEKGSTVVVTLSTAANVRLMDSTNFNAYKNGRKHRFTGGLVRKTPFRITVPRTGSWYLTRPSLSHGRAAAAADREVRTASVAQRYPT